MFVIKATLRDETRRISFDVNGFPNYSEIQDKVSCFWVANAPAAGGNDVAHCARGTRWGLRRQLHCGLAFCCRSSWRRAGNAPSSHMSRRSTMHSTRGHMGIR